MRLLLDTQSFLWMSLDESKLSEAACEIIADPFDRMLVAQAIVEKVPIISADVQLDAYGIERFW